MLIFDAKITSLYDEPKKVYATDPKTGAVLRDAAGREIMHVERVMTFCKIEKFVDGKLFGEDVLDLSALPETEADFFKVRFGKPLQITIQDKP